MHGMSHASRRARQSRQLSRIARSPGVDRARPSRSQLVPTSPSSRRLCRLHRFRRRGNPRKRPRPKRRSHPSPHAHLSPQSRGCRCHNRLLEICAGINQIALVTCLGICLCSGRLFTLREFAKGRQALRPPNAAMGTESCRSAICSHRRSLDITIKV